MYRRYWGAALGSYIYNCQLDRSQYQTISNYAQNTGHKPVSHTYKVYHIDQYRYELDLATSEFRCSLFDQVPVNIQNGVYLVRLQEVKQDFKASNQYYNVHQIKETKYDTIVCQEIQYPDNVETVYQCYIEVPVGTEKEVPVGTKAAPAPLPLALPLPLPEPITDKSQHIK